MIVPLIPYHDARLYQPCLAVKDEPIDELAKDLSETLMSFPTGIGLAAPQIGVLKQVFVLKFGPIPTVVVNPIILWESAETSTMKEGCLSFIGSYVNVTRPSAIKVAYQDETGHPHDEDLDGIRAAAFLHEFQHLNGITILDHAPEVERPIILQALERRLRRQHR